MPYFWVICVKGGKWIALVVLPLWGQGWVRGIVTDTGGVPVPFAIVENSRTHQGTLSDLQGAFQLQALPTDTIRVRCLGYEPYQSRVSQITGPIRLVPRALEVEPVILRPVENPAYRLIRAVNQAQERWDPHARPHQYLSYNKLTFSLPAPPAHNSLPPYLFLWETETEKIFAGPGREEERLLAQRTAGQLPLQSPLSPTTFQPLSLYTPWIELLDKRIASPIGSHALEYYDYELTDTTFDGVDTLYGIRFFPRRNREEGALAGHLTVSFPDAALRSFRGALTWKGGGTAFSYPTSLRIEQLYEKLGDTLWFPTQLHSELGLAARAGNTGRYVQLAVRTRSFLREIRIPPVQTVAPRSQIVLPMNPQLLSPARRAEALSPEEETSYRFIDSLVAHTSLRRMRWLWDLPTLMTGRFPLGPFNLLLRPLLLYHDAEGLRPQLGLETSDRISAHWRVRGWGGYGTYRWAGAQGTPWRYGAELELGQLSLLRLFAYEDVRERTLPRLLDQAPQTFPGTGQVYENFNRAYAFRWEDMVRERVAGLLFRLAPWGPLQPYFTAGLYERLAVPDRWQGYQATLGLVYLRESTLLQRGSALLRTAYKGPALHFQMGALFGEDRSYPYLQADFWHRGRAGRWADFDLRLSGVGFLRPEVPALWTIRLRSLSADFFSLPYALAAHPMRKTSTQVVYGFWRWSLPNRRFPSERWAPVFTLHLQGAWLPDTLLPEIGLSVRGWAPPALTRLVQNFAFLELSLFTRLSANLPHQRWYLRMGFAPS